LRLLLKEDCRWRAVEIRARRYLNNVIEQDHRAIKQRCASTRGLKSFRSAAITLAGIELAHRIRKGQHSLPITRQGQRSSLKEMWDCALGQANEQACYDKGPFPLMHQNSRARRGIEEEVLMPAIRPVRFPRKVSFGRNLYLRIPVHAGHQFRSMPGHDSGPCRATIPVDAGRGV
jgi:hypothetical protein